MPGYVCSKLSIRPSTAAGSMSPLAILILVLAAICSIDLVSEGSVVITTGATILALASTSACPSPLPLPTGVLAIAASPASSDPVTSGSLAIAASPASSLPASASACACACLLRASSSVCPSPLLLPTGFGTVIIATPFLL